MTLFKYKCFIFVISCFMFSEALADCAIGVNCIRLKDCQILSKQLSENRSDAFKNYARSLFCGRAANGDPKVCCPPRQTRIFVKPRSNFRYAPKPSKQSLLPDHTVCGVPPVGGRIVGGHETDIGDHPWTALLMYLSRHNAQFKCGGSLISSRYVLTAAHCLYMEDWILSKVRLGEWQISTTQDCVYDDCNFAPVDVAIDETIVHEDYGNGLTHAQHDIALLRLAKNVQFNHFIKPICLPLRKGLRRSALEQNNLEVAGWGVTESGRLSDVKRKVLLPVVQSSSCRVTFAQYGYNISSKQVCAGGRQGEDTCSGDSGSGLMLLDPVSNSWTVVGIVSFGHIKCGVYGVPGVYTKVGAYVRWILGKLKP